MLLLLPEITLTLIALLGQFFAVIIPNKNRIISNIIILLCILSIFLTFKYSSYERVWYSFATGINIGISKSIVLLFTIISMIIYRDYSILIAEELKFEFITLILLSVVGIFVAISSRNFLLLFCGMELTALTSYALAGFKLNDIK